MSVKVAVHEDGQIILVLGEGEDEEAWIVSPYLAENLGEELFRAAREGKANIAAKRGRRDVDNDG